MLKTAHRTETLLEGLQALESSIPPRARRLRELVAELRVDIDKLASRWSPLGAAAAAGELRERLDTLAASAEAISELVRDAQGLEGEIDELQARSHQQDDLEVSRFVRQRSDGWSGRLAEVAATAEPGWDPGADQDFLDDLEEELRRTFQALYWLGQMEEAEGLFDRVPDGTARARDDLREKLFASGAGDDWLLAVRDQVERVKEEAQREKSRPREIRTVGELMPLLHRWSAELELLRDEVRRLDGRHKRIVVEDWATSLPRELLGEAQRLIGALTARAREIRDENRRSLGEHMLELAGVCGEQPVLDEGVSRLDAREIARPEEHRQWLRDSARLRERMGAIANTHRAELDQRLTGRLEELRVALESLLSEPLPDEVLGLARQVETAAARLAEPEKTDQALRAMGEARALLEEVAGLRHRALAEAEALRAAQVDLRRKNRALQGEAARGSFEVVDLEGRIEDLATVDAETRSLEECKQAAARLTEELAALEDDLVDRCRARLSEDLHGVAELLTALRLVDAEAAPTDLPSVPHGVSPAVATSAVLASAELVRSLETRARVVAEHLDERRRKALTDLQQLELETLALGERDGAERLIEELEVGSCAPDFHHPDLHQSESLKHLGQLVEKAELFQDRIEEDQRGVLEGRDALRQRLEAFLEEGLRELCPWLTDRVTALVHGFADPPTPTPDVREQLAVTSDLLDKLELEAQRRAAHRLDIDVAALKEKIHDPSFSATATASALLEELDHHGRRTLPPAVLRLKIKRAVR